MAEDDGETHSESDVFSVNNVDASSAVAKNSSSLISYRQHLVDVAKITYPIILSEIFQNTLPVMDIVFVGHLGKQDLAAAALATVWFNLWNATMMGFMSAIDTLLAQSFGAKQYKHVGVWTGISLIIIFLTTLVVSGMVALCGPAMHLFGQDPQLADAAGEFAIRLIPGLFPYYLFKVLTKFLQTQNKTAPGVWIGILANAMNALFNWGLIFVAGWGVNGAPWATTLTRAMEFFLMVIYIYTQKNSLKETWPVFSRKNFHYDVLKPFWKLATFGALGATANAWSFEVTSILAGLLGTIALDAHIITLSIDSFIFLSFPFAIGIATSIRVGQLIGDQKLVDAQRSAHTSVFLGCITQAILIVILLPCKDILGHLFSTDEEVSSLVSQLIPILCIFLMGDGVHATIGGVFRGLGRQKLVLWLNILGFWLLALPIGAILTFAVGLGVFGLWWGMVIGIYMSAMTFIWYLRRVDWQKEAMETLRRLSTIDDAFNLRREQEDQSQTLITENTDDINYVLIPDDDESI
eukprot:CAMPEP_0202002586 /NCGR_PEP_ID=MMETSP0905-20130828/8379_1 /ASSEMBLY_ACC=CAM_ASM_000554 /TAXON_ID=420261 /ORGANISM="Thalassiosira antarctica, Strain CCMP982" /LENGTH=521 /DNA_ID=CAMNT_0048559519 /DNA_START=49 /DNA_END=1611 /DNA_ORIENTATION=+